MKLARNLVFGLSILILVLATGCTYDSKATYFGGSVLVEYHQTTASSNSDYLTFTFYDTGQYHLSFRATPGTDGRGSQYMPDDRDIIVDETPRVHLIEQYILPDFLRVTITKDGQSETHDFQ